MIDSCDQLVILICAILVMFASRLSIELFKAEAVSLKVTGRTKALPKTAAKFVVFTPEIDSE